LRPFYGCVPQPEKKRRLFDSHNPNSLMVAELRAIYHRNTPQGISGRPKAKKSINSSTTKLRFPPSILRIAALFHGLAANHLTKRVPAFELFQRERAAPTLRSAVIYGPQPPPDLPRQPGARQPGARQLRVLVYNKTRHQLLLVTPPDMQLLFRM